jgi:hypothetical protein
MKSILAIATVSAATLLSASAVAQKATAQGGEALVNASSVSVVRSISNQFTSQMPVPAKALLTEYLSSNWTKGGAPVKARLIGTIRLTDGTELSRGTLLLGHVDSVDVSKHGSNGTITLTFNEAKTKTGTILPIKATIVRVAQAFDPADPMFSVDLDTHFPLPNNPHIEVKPLTKGTVGVDSSETAALSGTVIRNGENLQLEDGTQFLLAITGAANIQASVATK